MNILKTRMMQAANPSLVEGLSRFFKTGKGQYGEGDLFLGIKVPVTRSIVKECWKNVSFIDLEECISSEYHETGLQPALPCPDIQILKTESLQSEGMHRLLSLEH